MSKVQGKEVDYCRKSDEKLYGVMEHMGLYEKFLCSFVHNVGLIMVVIYCILTVFSSVIINNIFLSKYY